MLRNACLLLLAIGAMGQAAKVEAPAVTVKVSPQATRLETRGGLGAPTTVDPLQLTVAVSNGSDRELHDLELVVPDGSDVTVKEAPQFPASLPPYGSFLGRFSLQPRSDLAYGSHELLLAVQYTWKDGAAEHTSMQTAAVTAEMKRPFEEEAKALPGGTAALFWLLLPVIFAFFAYELVDRWRRGEGFQVPTFRTEYLLPGFFIGLFVSSFAIEPRGLLLAIAAAAGAAWPALRWLWERYQDWRWAFRENDLESDYLRKALLSPRAPRRFWRATGEIDGQEWSGVRLAQPDGNLVLGSELQLIPTNAADRPAAESLLRAISADDWRRTRRALVDMVDNKTLTMKPKRKVEPLGLLATDDVAGFKVKAVSEAKEFLTLSS